MKTLRLVEATGAVIGLQVILGGALTFGFIDANIHIAVGVIAFILAILTLAVAATSKPRPRPVMQSFTGMIIALIVQGGLGFSTLGSGDDAVALVHFIIGVAMFGMAMIGITTAMRMGQRAPNPTVATS